MVVVSTWLRPGAAAAAAGAVAGASFFLPRMRPKPPSNPPKPGAGSACCEVWLPGAAATTKIISVSSGVPLSFLPSAASLAMASFICGYIARACVMFGDAAASEISGP